LKIVLNSDYCRELQLADKNQHLIKALAEQCGLLVWLKPEDFLSSIHDEGRVNTSAIISSCESVYDL